jgi:hypothetical protein
MARQLRGGFKTRAKSLLWPGPEGGLQAWTGGMTPFEKLAHKIFTDGDEIIFRRNDHLLYASKINEIDHTIQYTQEKNNKKIIDVLYTLFSAIDTKTSALLAHISIIVAGLLAVKGDYNDSSMRFFIMTEIIIYLVITIPCLRAIRMISPSLESNDDISKIKLEYWKRRRYYNIASSMTFIATIILIFGFSTYGFYKTFIRDMAYDFDMLSVIENWIDHAALVVQAWQ